MDNLEEQFMKTLGLTQDLEQPRSLSAVEGGSAKLDDNLGTETITLNINNAGSLWGLREKFVGKICWS